MLNEQLKVVNEAILQAATRVGNSAPKVADEILESVFPQTCCAAREEGGFQILRRGFIGHVSKILKQSYPGENKQRDFASIDPKFAPYVEKLKSAAYYVEGAQEYVSVADLVVEPDLLNDARHHMRRKGEECLAEAERLDNLYYAVTS